VPQIYQNSLGMMPKVLSTDPILSVPNATGVGLPNIPTVPNVPTMIMNDAHECARIRFCELLDGRLKEPIISPINSRWRTAVILKIVLGPIFLFSYCILGFDERRDSYRLSSPIHTQLYSPKNSRYKKIYTCCISQSFKQEKKYCFIKYKL